MEAKFSSYFVRELKEEDRLWARQMIRERWGDEIVVAHGVVYRPAELSGFVAFEAGEQRAVGLITYVIQKNACEIVTLDSLIERKGIGSRLIDAVRETAEQEGCDRLWLITTNDNLNALRFYQKYGFHLAALHKNVVEKERALKPSIPLTGEFGIPIRDELELEIKLMRFVE